MKDSVRIYDFARESGPLTIRPDPAFRLGNQANGVLEGAIFLWLDEVGRPEAAAQVFLHKDPRQPRRQVAPRVHLALDRPIRRPPGRRRAMVADRPRRRLSARPGRAQAGFEPRPAAPPDAGDRRGVQGRRRLRGRREHIVALRLLTTPVARYGKAGVVPEDGALFAFVEGTDPEVFLFVEARKGVNGPEWQYACAPMSCWPLKVEHKGRNVWEVPRRSSDDPSKPFFCLTYRP